MSAGLIRSSGCTGRCPERSKGETHGTGLGEEGREALGSAGGASGGVEDATVGGEAVLERVLSATRWC